MSVIEKERTMQYKGRCVQVVPHIPLEVIDRIKAAAAKAKADVMVIEIGGTVGEYENILFLEAARMMKLSNPDDVAFVLVSYLPVPGHLGEMKTKPTQHAARALNNCGIQPDFIIARGHDELDKPRREKLAFFCWLHCKEDVLSAPDVRSIYEIPAFFEKQNFSKLLGERLKLKFKSSKTNDWDNFVERMHKAVKPVKIAVVGKYFGTGNYTLSDSYISVIEAVKHASWENGVKPEMTWIDSEEFEQNPGAIKRLSGFDGIIVPGGWGSRGIEGVISTIKFARKKKIPYLGLCYGMQLACVEFARNVLGKTKASTVEINPNTPDPIIHINPCQAENVKNNRFGGTLRLGAYNCVIKKNSKVFKAYGQEKISERHRHRYEFNNDYRESLDKAGLKIVGINPESDLVEMVELEKHPFFVGVQFHPELKSRPLHPHPLFEAFIKACL